MQEKKIEDFLRELGSDAPTPGGGGAAGLVAAIGMSLGSMVLALTTGKKKYAAYQDEIETLQKQAEALTLKLAECMDKDAEAFEPLSKAYGLPKDTPEQVSYRDTVMAEALVTAAEAPLAMMDEILAAMKLIRRIAEIGSRLAISDAGVAIQCCMAALNSASLNVFINTGLMKDRQQAGRLEKQAEDFLSDGAKIFEETYCAVMKKIR